MEEQWRYRETTINQEDKMPKYRIAAVPGDGIGKEVIAAGIEVLNALAKRDDKFSFEFESFDWGSDYYNPTVPKNRYSTEESIA
jgi:isocitrate/isopropylmalate dehydrogenase